MKFNKIRSVRKSVDVRLRGGKKEKEYIEFSEGDVQITQGREHSVMFLDMGNGVIHVEDYMWFDEPDDFWDEKHIGWFAVNMNPLGLGWYKKIDVKVI